MTQLYYKYRMNKTTWLFIFFWPVVMGRLNVPFFYAMVPAYALTVFAIAIELRQWDFHNALKSVGGLACVYVLWSVLYGLSKGEF